ncbi:XTP/dITP diphosphatase [Mangrovibacillus cuniculi]|uniref:dITP/XTP pyrophosphatase n=1 Tax=Mangrovibacillus cuniculi TaxID=2593652 RepID=A0A7S8CBW2_9BACI|nr:XTP/dITP diphosphatase [Mangrovibacillus cuniculi]QPC47147.1 XTP/dITP diphosphatase [Mangrovibacillus cuniculi]
MKTVIIATHNQGKAKEFVTLFGEFGYEVKTLVDFPDAPDVEETGTTFEENAILKAEAISSLYNTMVIADDSGLSIDALDGRPGVYSARYAGEEKSDEANIVKILEELRNVSAEKRSASFVCCLAVASPNKETFTVRGTCDGIITEAPQGTNGFGYDPIFYIEELQKTFAEASSQEKNERSHRGNALKKLKGLLPELLGE